MVLRLGLGGDAEGFQTSFGGIRVGFGGGGSERASWGVSWGDSGGIQKGFKGIRRDSKGVQEDSGDSGSHAGGKSQGRIAFSS